MKTKILLIEPPGGYIRLDRCMQSAGSWGGVFRFPINFARIAAGLISAGYEVQFIDMQADKTANLKKTILHFKPTLCILSSGFPSMKIDSRIADDIKKLNSKIHVSTFGVAPTLLKDKFFDFETWGWKNAFDSIVIGGEPALGYIELIQNNFEQKIVQSIMKKNKSIDPIPGRHLFKHELYISPFNGYVQTYIEGSYGCPNECSFCVVPQYYGKHFSKRSAQDVVNEFRYAIENNGVMQISLWDEGTTFQKKQLREIAEGLIELRKSNDPRFQNFVWNTRSTTSLVDEELAFLLKKSGLTGLTLGLESFDEEILTSTGKGTTVSNNIKAIKILKKAGIISIGHIVLGLPDETKESAERTIQGVIDSGVDIAQFYCAVPYPGTPLYEQAMRDNLIRVTDLTKYELSNPIMDTYSLSYLEVGKLRDEAMRRFYDSKKSRNLNIQMLHTKEFKKWAKI